MPKSLMRDDDMVAPGGRSRVFKISRFSPWSPTVTCILAALRSAYLSLGLSLSMLSNFALAKYGFKLRNAS